MSDIKQKSLADFKVQTLINELAGVMVLSELALQRGALTAATIHNNIRGRFSEVADELQQGTIRIPPATLYPLMQGLGLGTEKEPGELLIKKDQEENTYLLTPKGRAHLKKRVRTALVFANNLRELLKEVTKSLDIKE